MIEEVELEINLSIGNHKYVIKVPKQSNLPSLV
jgi:hypothetical protein